jgi:hypothetical protein
VNERPNEWPVASRRLGVRREGEERVTHILSRFLPALFVAGAIANLCRAGGIVIVPMSPGTVLCVRPLAYSELPALTNAIPFQESFEQYANNAHVKGSRGWYGSATDTSFATNTPLPVGVTDFPIQTNHTRYAVIRTEGSWLVNAVRGGQQHVWMDMLMAFVLSEDAPPTTGSPQLVLWANANSNLCVFAQKPNTGVASVIASSRKVGQDTWSPPHVFHRLSIHLAYLAAPTGACFAVFLDGTAVEWTGGERLPGVAGTGGQGPWLRCVPLSGSQFPGVAFGGNCRLDDLVVTGGYPLPTGKPVASLGDGVHTLSWPSDFGRTYQAESCTNLVNHNWQPFGPIVTGNGMTNTLPVSTSDGPTRFFRVCSPDS